ncbi:IS110 family transposase [Actinotalea sp. C106]|uniref:IS110 family transposase n=1 Tax=Actinotalea sp. C106 TaxID=2908644 RepID=UPI002028AA44|nr:IS110 family transposase [Actinotalea sp. C106]
MESQRAVIGMDPHKRSVTIEVMAGDGTVLGGGRLATDPEVFTALGEYVLAWPIATGQGRKTDATDAH